MRKIKIPIIENKRGSQAILFDKLPNSAKKLFVVIARMVESGNDPVSMNNIRNLGEFGTTPEIEQLLYTLESRGFGEVKVNGAETYFLGNKILMQSVL
jgi:hypothetical protein